MTPRRVHEATRAAEAYSPAEELFNRRRRTAGLFAAPLVFVALLVAPLPLASSAHRLAAVIGMTIVLWMTEALPLAVTALLGPVLAIVLGVATARAAFAPFADPIIFLFIGSFILAEAMFVHGLDRRVAFRALSSPVVSGSAVRILIVYGTIAAAISMWISNTATTAMMFPIGLSIVARVTEGHESEPGSREFALAMMLICAFGASIGGIATPIGTPPNLIGIGMLNRIADIDLSFFEWMSLGVPVAGLTFTFLVAYFSFWTLRGLRLSPGGREALRAELERLGPVSTGQRNVLIAFGLTVALWLLPGGLALTGAGESRSPGGSLPPFPSRLPR